MTAKLLKIGARDFWKTKTSSGLLYSIWKNKTKNQKNQNQNQKKTQN